MGTNEIVAFLDQVKQIILKDESWLACTREPIEQAFGRATRSLKAWEEVQKEIADIPLTFWDYENNPHTLSGEAVKDAAQRIIRNHLAEMEAGHD